MNSIALAGHPSLDLLTKASDLLTSYVTISCSMKTLTLYSANNIFLDSCLPGCDST
jgi:hypothetical protein